MKNNEEGKSIRMRCLYLLKGDVQIFNEHVDNLIEEGVSSSVWVILHAADRICLERIGVARVARIFELYARTRNETDPYSTLNTDNKISIIEWVNNLPPEMVIEVLDNLIPLVTCKCEKSLYECRCLFDLSSVAGHLLDRILEYKPKYGSDTLYRWISKLRFKTQRSHGASYELSLIHISEPTRPY